MIPPQKLRTKTKRPDASVVKLGAKADTMMRRTGSGSKSSLENVLSKEFLQHRRSMSRGPSGMIALMRSASTPSLPAMKREASEPAGISKIPLEDEDDNAIRQEPTRAHGVRRNLGNDRVKKDARVHAELKNAITALRRPNRDVVGQAMVEDAERRATTTLSQLKSECFSCTETGVRPTDCLQNLESHKCILECTVWSKPHPPRLVSGMFLDKRPSANPRSRPSRKTSTFMMRHPRHRWCLHQGQENNGAPWAWRNMSGPPSDLERTKSRLRPRSRHRRDLSTCLLRRQNRVYWPRLQSCRGRFHSLVSSKLAIEPISRTEIAAFRCRRHQAWVLWRPRSSEVHHPWPIL